MQIEQTNGTREALGFKIEAAIPIPQSRGRDGFGAKQKYPFDNLGVGESFFVHGKTAAKMSCSCGMWGKKLGWKFIARTMDGGARVWRVR